MTCKNAYKMAPLAFSTLMTKRGCTTPLPKTSMQKDTKTPPLTLKDNTIDRVEKFKLLGTWLSKDITWTEQVKVNEVASSCYKVLATLRKINNTGTPQETEKSLGQSLELSKLNLNYYVTCPLPAFLQNRVQRVQNAAAGFVLNRFCSERDVLELGWLSTLENTQLNILKTSSSFQ